MIETFDVIHEIYDVYQLWMMICDGESCANVLFPQYVRKQVRNRPCQANID